jgi:hypothetical protein
MSHYVLTHRYATQQLRGLGSLGSTNPLAPALQQIERVVKQQVEQVVRQQSDRAINIVGERADRYINSPKGEALLKKFENKVETALVNVAYKRRVEISMFAISIAALSVVGVALGAKVGKKGIQIATGVALSASLPLLLSSPPPTAVRK